MGVDGDTAADAQAQRGSAPHAAHVQVSPPAACLLASQRSSDVATPPPHTPLLSLSNSVLAGGWTKSGLSPAP